MTGDAASRPGDVGVVFYFEEYELPHERNKQIALDGSLVRAHALSASLLDSQFTTLFFRASVPTLSSVLITLCVETTQ